MYIRVHRDMCALCTLPRNMMPKTYFENFVKSFNFYVVQICGLILIKYTHVRQPQSFRHKNTRANRHLKSFELHKLNFDRRDY